MKVKIPVPEPLKTLSKHLSSHLYIVGGYVRDYILYGKTSSDLDIAAPVLVEEVESVALSLGFKIVAVYKKTGTIKLRYNESEFEYTSFRTEKYSLGGVHTPNEVTFTNDIRLDATRRDFKCNAIYYDVKGDMIVDVLNGINDLKNGTIDTVVAPEKVFSCDGLRLLRLARFSAKHSLEPKKEVLNKAKKYHYLVLDIAPDRVKDELIKILNENASTTKKGLEILIKTGVLRTIFDKSQPIKGELSYAKIVSLVSPRLRFFALAYLYDKKPFNVTQRLEILKISKTEIKNFLPTLNLLYAFFFNAKTDKEIRRLILDNYNGFNDFFDIAPSIILGENTRLLARLKQWILIKDKLEKNSVPTSIIELKITAKELIDLGVEPKKIKSVLHSLLALCQKRPSLNDKTKLVRLIKK